MPTTLRTGEIAIVSYEADVTTASTGDNDALRIVIMGPVVAGTVIYITDRNWNGTAFAAAGGDGTLTYTAAGPLAAGTVLTFTRAQLTAAGITHNTGGDTLYVYQGTTADAPTTFLHALDYGDGNATFNGSLTNTGLVAGVSAVAVAHDNASWQGSATQIYQSMFASINTNANWYGSDLGDTGATTGYTEVVDTQVGNQGDAFPESSNDTYHNAMDMVMIAGMAGGGQSDAILRIGRDEGATVGSNLTRLFRDNPAFNHITDVTFDIQDGYFFFVDSDGNATNRIMRGNIADLVSGNTNPTFTQVFATDGFGEIIPGIEINTATNQIYWWDGDLTGNFEGGWQLLRANYDGSGLTQVALLDDENPDPTFGIPGGIGDWALDITRGFAYVVSSTSVVDGLGNASVTTNHILRVTLSTGVITVLALDVADARSQAAGGGYNGGRLDPLEGQIMALDVDTTTGIIYFITQPIGPSNSGGIWSYNPTTDDLVELWNQPTNNAHNTLQTFPTSNMTHIEVDEIGGRIYISATSDTDTEVDGTATNESDAAIFSLAIGAAPGTAPTLFVRVFEPTANGAPQGLEIDYAPTVTNLVGAGSTYTESTTAPNSSAGPGVQVAGAPTVADPDNTIIQGATVAITTGFVAGDVLGFTNSGGITGSYNAATGIITFTGAASFAAYQTVLDSITFTNAGDNPTNYGEATSRTISFQVFDGLAFSDPATAVVNVVGINDAPVNNGGAPMSFTEDSTGTSGNATPPPAPVNAITGISVFDVDANPTTQDIVVTLSVNVGTLTIRTDVSGGLVPGDVAGNGTATLVLTGTQAEINATLAAVNNSAQANGLVYTPTLDYHGAVTLTRIVNDQGNNGNDPGNSGTGTTEQDSDTLAITVTAVADIANDAVNIVEDAGAQNLDLLANDTFENSGRTITAVGSAAHATVSIHNNGTPGDPTDDFVVYTANANYNGSDSFTYTVTSGGATETATVNVTIASVNDDPAGADNTLTLDEDSTYVFTAADFGFGDPADGDSLASVTVTTLPTDGTIYLDTDGPGGNAPSAVVAGDNVAASIIAAGGLTFVPDANEFGNSYATFTFQVVDDGGTALGGQDTDQSPNTMTFDVTAVDDPAVALDDAFTTDEASAIVGGDLFADNGSGADGDIDGPPLSVGEVNSSAASVGTQITLPSGALLTVNADGTFDYDPNGAFDPTPTLASGASNTPDSDSFTYTLTEGGTALVTITIDGIDTDDTLLGTGGDDALNGGLGVDTISGLAGNDSIRGGGAADTMIGGTGNDSYYINQADDVVVEAAGEGEDRVLINSSYALAAGASIEILAVRSQPTTNAVNLTGNELANRIYGNAGNNVLDGGAGVDRLYGDGGDDTYIVDDAADRVTEFTGQGNDTVRTSVDYALGAGVHVETLETTNALGTAALSLAGNELANTIVGNAGNNVLAGAGGADTMTGGAGDDRYFVNEAGDVVVETAGQGEDRVLCDSSYTLAAGSSVEILSVRNQTLTTAIDLTGNELANSIYGNAGANVLDGGGAADRLFGDVGNDTLIGGAGADRLTGGAGNDVFEYNATSESTLASLDHILDYASGDDIDLSGIDANTGLGADQAFAFVGTAAFTNTAGELRYEQVGGNTFVYGDTNGDGTADFAVRLDGLHTVTGDYFVL